MKSLTDVEIDPSVKGSINYAKARAAIEQFAKNRQEKRLCKRIVIEHLHGKVEQGKTLKNGSRLSNLVRFEDGSVAKY